MEFTKDSFEEIIEGKTKILVPKKSLTEYYYKNADCDELIFVHKGSGKLRTLLGNIEFGLVGPMLACCAIVPILIIMLLNHQLYPIHLLQHNLSLLYSLLHQRESPDPYEILIALLEIWLD